MTRENMLKLLEQGQGELINILLDEAQKLELDETDAERLALEAYSDLCRELEHGVN